MRLGWRDRGCVWGEDDGFYFYFISLYTPHTMTTLNIRRRLVFVESNDQILVTRVLLRNQTDLTGTWVYTSCKVTCFLVTFKTYLVTSRRTRSMTEFFLIDTRTFYVNRSGWWRFRFGWDKGFRKVMRSSV